MLNRELVVDYLTKFYLPKGLLLKLFPSKLFQNKTKLVALL